MKKSKRSFELEENEMDSSEEMGIELGELEEEIIQLEDIVELPDESSQERDPLDLDADLLDAESDLDLDALDLEFSSKEESGLQDDLLQEFDLTDEPSEVSGSGQETLLTEEDLQSKEGFEPFLEIDRETIPQADEKASPVIAAAVAVTGAVALEESSLGQGAALEDFVGQIEARLIETVQQMVESRLPEIVRAVLREEIDRLTHELKQQ